VNALFKNIKWNEVEAVGFDMDGTLYDEFEFISRVYSEINIRLINDLEVLSFMKKSWLEKGSSYPFIFQEAYSMAASLKMSEDAFINSAILIFRGFEPNLVLSKRVKMLLGCLKDKYPLFLITDGNSTLQRKKFLSLGLSEYFAENNVVFTGDFNSEFHKPNIGSLTKISINSEKLVYFGDRNIDEQFALDSGMQFQKVYEMIQYK
jgi:FMN phosphatase YigB (HAD superfamily)